MGRFYQGAVIVLISLLNHFAGQSLLLSLQEKLKRTDCFVISGVKPTANPPEESGDTQTKKTPKASLSLDIPERRADRFPSVDDRLKVRNSANDILVRAQTSII